MKLEIFKPFIVCWLKFHSQIKQSLPIFFFLGLAVIAGIRFLNGLDSAVYQCDEYSYLRKSYFLDLYTKGRFTDVQWQKPDATDQTKLMEYVYGIPSQVLYQKSFINLAEEESKRYGESFVNYSDWAVTYGQPANELAVSDKLKQVLFAGRMISALLTIVYILLLCLALFWLTDNSYLVTGLGFIFLLTHPIINIHGKQVLADSALNMFFVLGLLIMLLWWQIFWKQKQNWKTLGFLTLLSGLMGGLAAATKLNGFIHLIIAEFFIALAVLLSLWRLKNSISSKKKQLTRLVLLGILQAGVTLFVFISLHPNIWDNPLTGIKNFIEWRWWITAYYQDYFQEDSLTSWWEIMQYIFMRVAGYLPGVGSIGFHYESRFKSLSLAWYFIPNVLFFVLGFREIFQRLVKKHGYRQKVLPAAIWSLGFILIVSIYLKLDWTRYYWPLIGPFVIINSLGLLSLIREITKLWRKS